MNRFAIFAAFAVASMACNAQLEPRTPAARSVSDPDMLIDDRGAKLEVLPASRAFQQMSASGSGVVVSVFAASESAPISPQQRGVVFNYAMQVQGYITGEIAFKMIGASDPTSTFDAGLYPGLKKLADPNIYIVVATTPAEFVQVTRRLQGRQDVEWVEPIVTYDAQQITPDAR